MLIWYFSNNLDKILFLLKFHEARISEWNIPNRRYFVLVAYCVSWVLISASHCPAKFWHLHPQPSARQGQMTDYCIRLTGQEREGYQDRGISGYQPCCVIPTIHCNSMHWIALCCLTAYKTLHIIALNSTPLEWTTIHYISLHWTSL